MVGPLLILRIIIIFMAQLKPFAAKSRILRRLFGDAAAQSSFECHLAPLTFLPAVSRAIKTANDRVRERRRVTTTFSPPR